MTVTGGCHLCGLPREDKESVDVLVTDYWHAYAPCDITPGAFLVQTRRHVEGLWSLDPGECESLGRVLRDVSDAIRDVYSAERVYVAAMGEAHPHFHMMLVPRGAAVPVKNRGLMYFTTYLHGQSPADRALVRSVAARAQARNALDGPAVGEVSGQATAL
jgi:diadenosine tetraphosphate (Ap4A) HIT family hydrolase